MGVETLDEMQVGVAEARDRGADQYFPWPGIRQADVLDHQGLVDFVEDGGLHRISP
jgi:hypothetical protein